MWIIASTHGHLHAEKELLKFLAIWPVQIIAKNVFFCQKKFLIWSSSILPKMRSKCTQSFIYVGIQYTFFIYEYFLKCTQKIYIYIFFF